MRKILLVLMLALAAGAGRQAAADVPPPPPREEKVREIFVPFEDLNVLLEGPTERVLLSREQYDELLAKARKTAQSRAPRQAVLLSADYTAKAGQERAEISAALVVDVLEEGLHTVGLDAAGVGLRRAALNGKSAAIGLADDGRLTLFVEGKGRHNLALEIVAPLATTAARQVLNFRLPMPPAAKFRLTVPGDVEVKSGAPVVSRVFDEKAGETRLELLPPPGDVSLVMTLNSRLKRKDRVVVARSVLVDEVTQAYERLHATVSLAILHRAVDQFRFAVPAGFEVTDVQSPLLARWGMATEGGRRVLEVQLREETTDPVVLALSALRTSPALESWALPHLEPLDVVGHVAVVGLVAEDRLRTESVEPEGLIRIDTSVLAKALPATVLEAEPGAVRLRPVVAYYAPQGAFGLAARFVKPPAKVRLMSNLLLILNEGGQEIRGGFAVVPEEERLFGFDFTVPAGWDVTGVTGEKVEPLAFERYGAAGAPGRIHVRLPTPVLPGQERRVYFHAVYAPRNWLSDWKTIGAEFPVFAVAGAARDEGAIAVDAADDMTVRPDALDRLTPLDENEKAKYGLADVSAALAYRYDGQPYQARLVVERTLPRVTAQTYSFFRVERDLVVAHYELVYDVKEARTRRLSLLLPAGTPAALAIRGLDNLVLKEYTSETVGEKGKEKRRWTALLNERLGGTVRLAVDFEQRLDALGAGELALPVVEADGVVYQSGRAAVEGSPELDVQVAAHPRRVDIGELVDAEYQPGRRLLGAYGFLGEPAPLKVTVSRRAAYPLPPAIVQRAELATVLSADGVSQTAARFLLRTKALLLEVKLPEGSTLWSATLDSKPAKPQREGQSLLVSLPAAEGAGAAEGIVRDLTIVYETPVSGLGLYRGLRVLAPRLFLHAGPGTGGEEVPLADLQWELYLPTGYRVVRVEGNIISEEVEPPTLAVSDVVGLAYVGTGGVDFSHGLLGLTCAVQPAMSSRMARRAWAPAAGEAGRQTEEYYSREGEKKADELAERVPEKPAGPPAMKPLEVPLPKPMFAGTPKRPTAVAPPVAAPAPAVTAEPTTPSEAPPPATAAKPPPPAKVKAGWALEGVSSLQIDLQQTGEAIICRSLGAEPRLGLTVVNTERLDSLALGLALAVILIGLAMTTQPAGRKAAYVVGVGLVATLIPVITGRLDLALVVNGTFYAACLLVPYYLVVGAVRHVARKVREVLAPSSAATTAVLLVMALAGGLAAAAATAAEPAAPYVIQIVPPPPPVKVPDDALILPYDPAAKVGIPSVDRVLVPYAKYVELWNLAYPDKPIGAKPPPAPYALAGAEFTATLKGDEYLLVEGRVDLDVFTDGYATVPLPLDGGVLARADLDGRPARLSVMQAAPVAPPPPANPQPMTAPPPQRAEVQAEKPPPARSFIVLYASGKGRHRLDLAVRMRLERRGGWRVTEGRLPAAPATALALAVPDAATEVRLGGVADRRSYETQAAGETIQTAVGADGALSVQWRPKVTEGQIDQTLTVDSAASLDVQEDQLRLKGSLALEFRRGEREFFTVEVPLGYLVEKVEGQNVRGWELKSSGARQDLEVTLLKRAKGSEQFTVSLWRPGPAAAPGSQTPSAAAVEFDVPVVGVTGAVRHSGRLTIRRSPLLDLRTVSTAGVTRTDLPAEAARAAAPGDDESPLGIRPYQAYQFAATPFTVRLALAPVAARVSAVVQTILRIAERQRFLETRALLRVENRPLYRVRLVIPEDLRIDTVQVPGASPWAVTDENGRKVLTVYLSAGVVGDCPVVLRGTLGPAQPVTEVAVPRIEVLDVDRQDGDLVVQADPAFEVRAEGLRGIERVLLQKVFGWLTAGQRGLAQLALHWTQPDYAGKFTLTARKPDVACFTVTNSRVTDRSIEDAVLIDWTIKNAGIREVSFLLPAWMKDARVSVPLLRQKTVKPVSDEPGALVRVRLELQDEVMDQLRVLVENDRLLVGGEHGSPVPVVETGRTDRRYVALESAGRDETVLDRQDGLEPLSRQQKEWAAVAGMLRGGMTQAFIVAAGAEKPQLVFHTKERAAVETARARIGLAQAVLVMDPTGAYRAQQVYRIDNRTEQFLEVEMPPGASLWTAVVAGEPVKPTLLEDKARPGLVRIPLVKTAAGDLDYVVVLKYGGKRAALGSLSPSVTFPLIRTAKIHVELSQVELYLPETEVWFDFRGTMRRVAEEGEFEAGILSYQNKQAERLVQTLRFDNPFAQARAQSNLTNLKSTIQHYQEAAGAYTYNKSLQMESSNASAILQNADREIQGQAAQAGAAQAAGNNDFIRDAYAGQGNVRARNLVGTLGDNWKEQPQVVAGGTLTVSGRFNDAWLAQNRLENVEVAEQQKKPQSKAQQQRLDLTDLGVQAGAQAAVQLQPSAPDVAQTDVKRALQKQSYGVERGRIAAQDQRKQAEEKGQPMEQLRRSGVEDMVERYQQKLQERAKQERQVAAPDRDKDISGLVAGGPGRSGRSYGAAAGIGGGGGGARGAARGGEEVGFDQTLAAPTGLVSLDVELPLRGVRYRFTTPRGEVEVRAAAVSLALIEGLERVGGVALFAVLVLVVRRALRGRSISLRSQGLVSTVLIVLGVAGLLVGVLPVAGLAAVIAGIVMKVRLYMVRRRPAAA